MGEQPAKAASDEFGDRLEEAILALEAANNLLDDSDSRADPLSWLIDRLTEMSVIGQELVPDWYHALQDHEPTRRDRAAALLTTAEVDGILDAHGV